MLGLVSGNQPAGGGDDPPPGQIGRPGGQQMAHGPGRAGATGVGRHLSVGDDLPRPQPPDDLLGAFSEAAVAGQLALLAADAAGSAILRPNRRRNIFHSGS